jgi:hypothetical protein
MRHFALAFLLLSAASAAQAQAVYRCGAAYSQQPCAGGTTVAVDARTPADAQRAQSNAQRDAKLADAMEKQRLAQEARAPKALVIGGEPAPPPANQPVPAGRKLKKGEKPVHFVAVTPRDPGEAGAKKKKAKKQD